MTTVYTFKYYNYLNRKKNFSVKRFKNRELHISLKNKVTKKAVVIGTINPLEENLFTFLQLCHTLKKEKCRRIRAIIPYLAYSRQDRDEKGKSLAIDLIGKLLKAAGVDELVTFDIHSKVKFPMPVYSISVAKLFAKELENENFTIVAPDEGAEKRAKELAQIVKKRVVVIPKKRDESGIKHFEFKGKLTKKIVIVDDILDTGETLISCCKKLLESGKKEIVIMVTHGLFSGNKWKELWQLGVRKIYVTNSLPIEEKGVKVLKINGLLKPWEK